MIKTSTNIDILLEGCASGNQRAQMAVYKRYYHAMYNTAVRIVKDTAAAEDIMQESFLNAFAKLDTYKGMATFGSWLKRIVVNNSLTYYQKQKKLGEVPLEENLTEVAANPDPEPCGDNRSQINQVLNAMEQLRENYRVALTLHLIEGYDYEELSGILNIQEGNCRTLVSRAKNSLRKRIEILK
ncbi:MAG: RNA polymerase sigma factor [Leeuwenhoekiella sp.]